MGLTLQENQQDARQIESVVASVQRGETERFAIIIDAYQQQIFRYCCRMLGNVQDAEDAVQDIMVKAYQSISRYRPEVSFSAWLYRIASNHCLNLLRRRKLHRQIMNIFRPSLLAASPEQEMEKRLYSYPLEKALAELTPEERNILVLRVLEQRSFAEMSEILHISANALTKRMTTIKRKVQAAMAAEEEMTCQEPNSVMSTKI
ncbi:RNA polymerase sigma factor [Paenibacillus sp. FSL M8-0334]|uniref:RNA polymerase sigma factor n=1 Tax=Paenibacillus sp. FSL M8-0334 TaxID=2921623 RepID=UPI0030F65E2C